MKVNQQELDYFRLKKEIKNGKLRSVYVFTGSEDYLMDEMASEICAGILPAEASATNRVNGGDLSLEQVLDMAETVSLFGGARLVVVRAAPYFAKSYQGEGSFPRLLTLNSKPADSAHLIIYASEFTKTTKACKELAASGAVYRFNQFKPAMIYSWLRERMAVHGKTAPHDVLVTFVQRVGRDLRRLSSEMDKLITYMGGRRELDEPTVLTATARSLQGDIFALTDAVINGRTSRAMALMQDLLGAGEPPLRILAMLVRQFRMLGESVELLQGGCALDELAVRLGVYPFVAEKLASQASITSGDDLSRAVDLLLQVDLDIKRGRIEQSLALETLIVALGQKSA
ncbi:MAG: DNA polymerase III subunit delta [Dethiobacter sp.]|nr:DNA polymerase III subunit delta [Dethiobacter sp.]